MLEIMDVHDSSKEPGCCYVDMRLAPGSIQPLYPYYSKHLSKKG